jgi:hypothetical protein
MADALPPLPPTCFDPHFRDVKGAVVFKEVVVAIVSNDIILKKNIECFYQL